MASEASMTPCVCMICGHVYDPDVGEPKQGIAPGVAFADLPVDWTCPICGAAKTMFRER